MKKFLSSTKAKVLGGVAAVSTMSSNALAAGITMGADGTVTGDLNVGPFMSVAGAVIIVLAAIFAVKKGLSLLK
ncbi:hypothetical protein [Campylobacter concisus]|uniref:Uncharacterized protein n=1 Tax=Campylobacter concisus TaxID=199 RepID=A0A0M4TB62_9BACT|nr:hypothetical protein [Campylobacter concisus]ALF47511.1 hypothetical protein CCON33237_0828 [Campylobacter concisus]